MRNVIRFTILLTLCLSVHAQDAKIIQLNQQDAVEAKRLYDEMQAAKDKFYGFRVEIENRYTRVQSASCPPLTYGTSLKAGVLYYSTDVVWQYACYKAGWSDFTFSEDFKFIVPKPEQSTTGSIPYLPGGKWTTDSGFKLSTDSAVTFSAP